MSGRVIQGYFIGGAIRPQPVPRSAAAEARPRHSTGAPPPAFAGRAAPLQARMAPGRPPLAHQGAGPVAQPHGGNCSFEIDPVQLGLARGGGKPLPPALLAKMESALGADFSGVRVHVGPQAARIGAIAFTTGNDLYFAPGQFQPGTISGQQLIGHELAHVIQQRQGRVRAQGAEMAVVQDRALEAEADRLGMRAATQCPVLQSKTALRPNQPNPRAIQRAAPGPGPGPGFKAGVTATPMTFEDWSKSGQSTFSSIMWQMADGLMVDIAKTKSNKSVTHGAEHAEDVALRLIKENIDMFEPHGNIHPILLNISKSPCTSTVRIDAADGMPLPVTSSKAIGCTEELLAFQAAGYPNSAGNIVRFSFSLICRGLYCPIVAAHTQAKVLRASSAAIAALQAGNIAVNGDVRPKPTEARYGF